MHPNSNIIRMKYRGELLENEPLSLHTSLKVGGPADFFAIPQDTADLLNLLKAVKELQIPWFIIGGGYNLLIRDGGFRGVVISLKNLNHLKSTSGVIRAEAGVRNIDLARLAQAHSLTGLEFLVGIPGSLGGAVRMNAGAHGSEIFNHITSVEILVDGTIRHCDKNSLNYGYRCLQLGLDEIIIAANFQLVAATQETITASMDSCLQKRQEAQKVKLPSAGSFFKNPPGQQAWRLIEEAGLRGRIVGDAQVSEVHTNFLVNRGKATATDFLQLAAIIKEQVFSRCSIRLGEEVQILGED